MLKVKPAALIAAALVTAPALAMGERPEKSDAAIAQCVAAVAAAQDFHGSVLVAPLGRAPGYAGAFTSQAGPGEALAETTRMNYGSMGKMFTAVAIMQRVEAGEVDLDASVRRYLPTLPEGYDAITITHLLSHTAGTGNFFRPDTVAKLNDIRRARDLIPFVTAEPLAFAPGEKFRYSNSGYALLGAVIESVSGKSYADYVAEAVFTPAGMAATSMSPDDATAPGFTRMSPGAGPRTPPKADAPWRASRASGGFGTPAGGGYTTVGDLYRFADALMANKLLSPAATDRLFQTSPLTKTPTRSGRPLHYGAGFLIGYGGDQISHGGGAPGVNGELRIRRESGLVFAALTNTDPPAASNMVVTLEHAIANGEETPGCESFARE